MAKKVLIVNYFLFLGGGEKLLIELVDFCLAHNIKPEILIPDNIRFGDNQKEEHYDKYLKSKEVKIYRVPVFFKKYNLSILQFIYWRIKLKNAGLFYSSIHIINLNLADRMYEMINIRRRFFWHIINKMQWENGYPYNQKLVSNSADTIITINKYQLPEMQEYFKNILCRIVSFKLFLHKQRPA